MNIIDIELVRESYAKKAIEDKESKEMYFIKELIRRGYAVFIVPDDKCVSCTYEHKMDELIVYFKLLDEPHPNCVYRFFGIAPMFSLSFPNKPGLYKMNMKNEL